jgi:hypothetical protein
MGAVELHSWCNRYKLWSYVHHNTLCVLLDVQLALHQTGALPTMVQ